ncbi:hypothetical protein ACWEQ8_43425 [Streptomyces noursei]
MTRSIAAVTFSATWVGPEGILNPRLSVRHPDATKPESVRATDAGTRFRIDKPSDGMARVSYGVGDPRYDEHDQPWIREGGLWRYDSC